MSDSPRFVRDTLPADQGWGGHQLAKMNTELAKPMA